jgi:hypothetical protein
MFNVYSNTFLMTKFTLGQLVWCELLSTGGVMGTVIGLKKYKYTQNDFFYQQVHVLVTSKTKISQHTLFKVEGKSMVSPSWIKSELEKGHLVLCCSTPA